MKNSMAIVIAAFAVTVCVASATTVESPVNADILPVIEITAPTFSGVWSLDPAPAAQPNERTSDVNAPLSVRTNCYHRVEVYSDRINGKMARWDGTNYLAENTQLVNALKISLTDKTTNTDDDLTLSATSQPLIPNRIKTGSTALNYPIYLEQDLNQWLDAPTAVVGYSYHIEITFDGMLGI